MRLTKVTVKINVFFYNENYFTLDQKYGQDNQKKQQLDLCILAALLLGPEVFKNQQHVI